MKKILLIGALLLLSGVTFAQTVEASVTISSVKVAGGTVYVALYDSEQGLKKNQPVASFALSPDAASVAATVSVPAGDYYVTAYQDVNSNGKLDTKIIGIPKEPVGISNYDGKSIPGGFNKHKTKVDPTTKDVIVVLRDIG